MSDAIKIYNPDGSVNYYNYDLELPNTNATGLAFNGDPNMAVGVPQAPGATGAEAAGAAEGMSSMESIGAGSMAMSAGSAIASIISTIGNACLAEKQNKFQRDFAESNYEHEAAKNDIRKEMQINNLEYAEKKIRAQKKIQGQFHKATEENAQLKNHLKIVEARKKVMEENSEVGKMSAKDVDRIFRGKYSYGNPS